MTPTVHLKKGDQKNLEPPQAPETEQAILGAILKDPEAINKVIEVFDDSACFYVPRHRYIFNAILNLNEKGQPSDITTIAHELDRMGQLDKAGGRVYLVDLVETVASTANVETHAQIVLEMHTLRLLITTSNEIIDSCFNRDKPADELLDAAEAHVFEISEKRLRKSFVGINELIKPTIDQIEDFQVHGTGFGVRTGYTRLDEMTNGLHNGDFIVIAGRPSMGKTSLALNIAENIAISQSIGVGVFSIEMSKEALTLRMISRAATISQKKMRSGKINEAEWRKLASGADKLSRAPIYIDDSATLTALEMRAKARRLKAQHDVGLIIVDYIQLMSGYGRVENRQQEIAMISRGMKGLAKELNIPVIAISQLSRQVEQRGAKEKRPQLSDLRESGAIEQDADLVLFVYRPEVYLSPNERDLPENESMIGLAEIIIAKQRNGETGSIDLQFIKEHTRFENMDTIHREVPPGVTPVSGQDDVPF